jgi:AAHS family 4-hydroxybenzoate transporter-like MFS transporter
MSTAQLAVVALCTAALILDGYDIQVMALAVPSLARSWALPPSDFGWALSGVVIGITVGSGVLGPLGDRFGRRTMLIAAMATAGIATAATALATSPAQFVFWRCLTGAGLGAGIPSCAALTSEFSPVANRSWVMGLMNSGPPIGAFSAGLIAPAVLDTFGWRGTFVIGGVGPLLIAVLALGLPESLKFLYVRSPSDPRIARSLRKVAPEVHPSALQVRAPELTERRSPQDLIRPPYLRRTLLLWAMVCLNLFNLYVLVSWLPTILEQSGWNHAASLIGAVLIQAGGVMGGLSMSRFLDRGATKSALIGGFMLSAVCLASFAILPGGAVWIVLLLLVGAGISGSQLSLNTLSAAYYPPSIKATGVAWALVIGGVGSTVGPLVGAGLIERHLTPVTIVALLAFPSLLCAVCAAQLRQEWQAH